MLKVSTVHLSPDALQADESFDRHDLGELAAEQLVALLDVFRGLDSVQNHDAEPQIVIAGKAGKFVVRTGQGKLFLYNARDLNAPYLELTPGQVVARIDESLPEALPADQAAPAPAQPKKPAHRGVAVGLIVAGLLLNGYTLYSAFSIDDVNRLPPMTFISDAAELAKAERLVTGTFATGREEGDRSIEIRSGGHLQFTEYGQNGEIRLSSSDTYRIGQRNGKTCLATKAGHVIDITGSETVTFFRDTYRRRP